MPLGTANGLASGGLLYRSPVGYCEGRIGAIFWPGLSNPLLIAFPQNKDKNPLPSSFSAVQLT
jgi:hypothetical protein